MNSWLLIRRLRGPAFVILVGINCLLHEWGILSFGRSWPLYLILGGILGLAERAAWAATPLSRVSTVSALPAVSGLPHEYGSSHLDSAGGRSLL